MSHTSRSETLLSGSTGSARTRSNGVDVSLTVSTAPRSASSVFVAQQRARPSLSQRAQPQPMSRLVTRSYCRFPSRGMV